MSGGWRAMGVPECAHRLLSIPISSSTLGQRKRPSPRPCPVMLARRQRPPAATPAACAGAAAATAPGRGRGVGGRDRVGGAPRLSDLGPRGVALHSHRALATAFPI